jgi:TNF receptor-associated protein 1
MYMVIQEAGLQRGSKIVIHLRAGCEEYATKARVETIIKKYSNFVGVPIKLNDKVRNLYYILYMSYLLLIVKLFTIERTLL